MARWAVSLDPASVTAPLQSDFGQDNMVLSYFVLLLMHQLSHQQLDLQEAFWFVNHHLVMRSSSNSAYAESRRLNIYSI